MVKDKISTYDLGWIDDAITVLLDLTHLEIHSWKSFNQTKDKEWLELGDIARKERTELLEKICNKDLLKSSGELWCINKHSLRVIGGYIELGNRCYTQKDLEQAIYYFDKASTWLGIFLIKNNLKKA
ncbi:MAG: hypothetical protein PHF86_12495 [Candidatus Nanoarchaeia archaeon]|nr:hypothetical protein [Candidatus Nanoarchaeia archaeon]